MRWRVAYERYARAAGGAVAWLERAEFPEDVPEPKELCELDDAYEAVYPIVPRRNKAARYALEDFHGEFGKTIARLQTFGFTAELLEIRLLRLDRLFEELIPHALHLPRRFVWFLAVAAVLGPGSYVAFPEGLRSDIAAQSDGLYLLIIGSMLLSFSALIVAVVVKGIRSGRYLGITGVVIMLPALLNLVSVFAWAYWVPSDASGSCLNDPVGKLDALYFSLTTFTTTGFGDLAPVTTLCRAVATMQMITTFVIVSSLLTVYLGRASASGR